MLYTIKSVSDDGIFYLVNGWRKKFSFWKKWISFQKDDFFKSEASAKASLTKLLKVMGDYVDDIFYIVTADCNGCIINEMQYSLDKKLFRKEW